MADTLDTIKQRFALAKENQRTKFDKFNDFDFIYHSKLKKFDPTVASKVFNPILWSFIETIVTRLMAKNPTIAYKPRENSDKIQSQIMSDLFEYWFSKSDAYPKIISWIKDALVYGTGIIKVDWLTKAPRMVKSYVLDPEGNPVLGEDGQYKTIETPVVDYDDPRIVNVNIYDFFYDPNGIDIDDCKWVGYQYKANIDEMIAEEEANKANGKSFYNISALKRLKNSYLKKDNQYDDQRHLASGMSQLTEEDKTVNNFICWEMYEDDKLCVIGNEEEILYEGENPYWHGKKPFIKLVDSIVSQEFYGKGEIEPVEKQLHALNTIQNQRIVNVNRILNGMWKAKNSVDDDELQFIDNGIIHITDIDDATFITPPNVTQTAVQEQTLATEVIQRALGVTDYVQGVQTPGQTASEVEVKTQQANARFAHKVKILEETGLKRLGELVYQLYQQFITKDKVIKVTGPEGQQFARVSAGDISGEYDVIPESDSTLQVDQQAEFTKFANLFQMMQPYFKKTVPTATGTAEVGSLDENEFIKRLIEKSGEKDSDKFFAQNNIQQGGMNAGQNQQMGGQLPGQPTGPTGPIPQGVGGEAQGMPGL
jgi:hypothetical protein